MIKLNLKRYSWVLILVSGILCILAVSIPMFYYINTDNPTGNRYFWITGFLLKGDGSFELIYDKPIPVGISILGTVLITIIALVFIISALLAKIKDINIPMKGVIYLGLGVLLFILPFILQTVINLVESEGSIFGVINLFGPLIYFSGLLGITAGLEELKR